MKFGVVIFPGSNCDQDVIHVLRNVLGYEVIELWHKEDQLKGFTITDCIVLPGGFSYGDYLRSGAIARFSPVMGAVQEFAEKGGKVFGICNGFQILCESGLLPGALLRNEDQRFICKNIYIKAANNNSTLTSSIPEGRVLKIPIAHAEGRYYAPPEIISALQNEDRILFYYCDESGELTPESNVNGSVNNIAGICNQRGNVFGLMPHPERASEERLGNTDGMFIFQSLISQILVAPIQ